MENVLLNVINVYEPIIKNFRRRSDVLNGWGIAWKSRNDNAPKLENVPFSIGDGLGTTGWCVSASEALLLDPVFQTNIAFRKAKAKLISIDIKEQYYGHCYNGSQNKWHTAILVEDGNYKFVIDVTCRQFGNDFIEKDIWDFNSWQSKLRSPLCKHLMTDFDNNPETIMPITTNENRNKTFDISMLMHNLKDVTSITDGERSKLADFIFNQFNRINQNLILKNIGKDDYKYIEDVTKLLMNLPFKTLDKGYSVLAFETKQSALNWIELFLKNETLLPMYMFVSNSLYDSCSLNNIEFSDVNSSKSLSPLNEKTFIVFEFENLFGIDSDWFQDSEILLPNGIELLIKKENIFNSGKLVDETRETNTIIIKIENM